MRVQVKDFMSSPVMVAMVDYSVGEVRAILKKKHIHAVPVVELSRQLPTNKALIQGIISANDLGPGIEDSARASDVMTSKVHILHPDLSAKAAANTMLKKGVHHLVVMDDGDIIGMVSSLDFVKLVAEHKLD